MPEPDSETVAPSATGFWSSPASAVGASLAPAVTVTVTVSAEEVFTPSLTVKLNTKEALAASCVGAVNVGPAAVVELKVTVDPLVWVHA